MPWPEHWSGTMEKQVLSPEFWNTFVQEYWQKKPVVFKGILPETLLAGGDVIEIFGSFAAEQLAGPGALSKRRGGAARLFVEGRQIGPTEMIKFLPQSEHLGEYLKGVKANFGGARVGIILNDVELFSERAASVIRELVMPLISRVGIPMRNVESTIFAGDYDVTPFGIHKDECADVLTLVLSGKKRMLVWPEEYFEQHPERLEQLKFGNEVIANFEQDAVVLEASPGDLMYWPGSAYHVATGLGGVVATCGLGFWHKASISEMVGEVLRELLASKLGSRDTAVGTWQPGPGLPAELAASVGALRELAEGPDLQAALAKAWQARVDRLGFMAHRR
jgi:ribosomal protein L16 Arg81 hydroxylase